MPHTFPELPLDTKDVIEELATILTKGMLRLYDIQQIDIICDNSKKELALPVNLRITERDRKIFLKSKNLR